MMENVKGFKAAVAAIVAAMTALWGWFGWLVLIWVFCMTVDYITGYCAAMKNGEWSSAIAREGLWHKTGCVVAVIAAGVLDGVVGYLLGHINGLTLPFQYTVLICPLVVTWYLLMELGSIVENAGKLGAPIPTFLEGAIAVLKNKVNETGEHIAVEHEKEG